MQDNYTDSVDQEEVSADTTVNPIQHLQEIIEGMDQKELDDIGARLKTYVETDIQSRSDWLDRAEQAITLTTQVFEKKNWPWANASNIKYPIISIAAVQFHARSFPAIFGKDSLVKGKVVGRDPVGAKAARGKRVANYMNWQMLVEMNDWMDDQDRLLFLLPIIGSAYKKLDYDLSTNKPASTLVHPRDFIINYDAKDFENARKTHRIWKTPNKIKEFQNRGIYRELEDEYFDDVKTASEARDKTQGLNKNQGGDNDALQELYEVHCLLDLDGDGYKEPYIVTLRECDGRVYRITFGFDVDSVEFEDGKIIAIKPKEFFVPYFFLPDPESKVHGIGFGTMVGPINEAVNTIVNQLVDAGTLSNMQSGIIGRGIRLKGGNWRFSPGEWKQAQSTGDDLKKGIFPLPVREPSNVLFQLLGLLIDSGKDLSSVQDIMVGKNPGQNQPFSTSQMVVQQGLQVFNGIYKRIYRSVSKEFKLLYKINSKHLDLRKYMKVLDEGGEEVEQAKQEVGLLRIVRMLYKDFNTEDFDITPTAEPDMVADFQRIAKSASLLEKVGAGLPINVQEATKRMLEAEQHEDIEALLSLPEPRPDPEIVLKEQQLKIEQAKAEGQILLNKSEALLNEVKAKIELANAAKQDTAEIFQQYMQEKELLNKQYEAVTKRIQTLLKNESDRAAREQTKGNSGGNNS